MKMSSRRKVQNEPEKEGESEDESVVNKGVKKKENHYIAIIATGRLLANRGICPNIFENNTKLNISTFYIARIRIVNSRKDGIKTSVNISSKTIATTLTISHWCFSELEYAIQHLSQIVSVLVQGCFHH